MDSEHDAYYAQCGNKLDPRDKSIFLGSQSAAERTTFLLANLDAEKAIVDKSDLEAVNKFIAVTKPVATRPEKALSDSDRSDIKLKLSATIKNKHLKNLKKIQTDVTQTNFFFFLSFWLFLSLLCTQIALTLHLFLLFELASQKKTLDEYHEKMKKIQLPLDDTNLPTEKEIEGFVQSHFPVTSNFSAKKFFF